MSRSRRAFEGEPPDRDPKSIGLSASGHCARQLAYKRSGAPGEKLSFRALSIFSDGNYIQDQLRGWLKRYIKPTCYRLEAEEREVSLKTPNGHSVRGHVDGIIEHDPGCKHEQHRTKLLEIKSMGRRGFDRLSHALRNGGLEKSYVVQISCYLAALKLDEAILLAKCKDTSELFEIIIRRDDKLVRDALLRFDEVFDSADPSMVQRMYQPDEEGGLPWQCGYCPYIVECWKKYSPRQKREHLWVLDGDYQEATDKA